MENKNLTLVSDAYEKLKDTIGIIVNGQRNEEEIQDVYAALKEFQVIAAQLATPPIDKLTQLQMELGYKQGDVSPLALLGLFGEAGEVMDKAILFYPDAQPEVNDTLDLACIVARQIDALKKSIRTNPEVKAEVLIVGPDKERDEELDFNKELADAFYYINALAINRGLTLNDLAKLSIKKVEEKQAAKTMIDKG